MGVFKWLRRERVTVTTHHNVAPDASTSEQHSASEPQIGTIRSEKYKRDLAEFQARRSTGTKEPAETPEKLKRCGRHSLPVSCTDCATENDNTFSYEKKSAVKYKKNKRSQSITPEKVPNIQFLFQNQVFMPGHYQTSFSEPLKAKHQSRRSICRSPDFVIQKHIDFKEADRMQSPPEFYKNSSLPFDVRDFLEGSRSEVDGLQVAGDVSSHDLNNVGSASRDDKLWEVMSELKHLDQWADEQLQIKSPNTSRSDDSKSDTSASGLPIASARNLDINADKMKIWNHGRWGVIPVQIKKLNGVTIDQVRKKQSIEINILRKCRHPNIILLMGIYPDINNNVHIICERCVDSLFGILHVQGRILSAQTAVQYALDVANALVFLRMQGFIHTQLNSMSVMITNHDTAKLADLGPCANVNKVDKDLERTNKDYEVYSAKPHYVNIEDTCESKTSDSEPLLSANPSETYLKTHAISKPYEDFQNSELYRWQAPELFVPGDDGLVQPCSRSDAYSLSLILWESCNASIPWKMLTYEKLKEQYTLWETGMVLPQDGTYPGGLLSLLQAGLKIKRTDRIDLETLQQTLQTVKRDLDDIGYVIIPARLKNTKPTFSTTVWDTTSPTDSDCQSPQNVQHEAVVHNTKDSEDSSTESSEKDTKSDTTPLYETIKKSYATYSVTKSCRIPDNDNSDCSVVPKYDLLPEKEFSSACSTPIAKLRARIKDIETPGTLHRSDSTEYCSILSPNRTTILGFNDESNKEQSCERATAKLSRSFTPKSYKPLHIKVPEYNLDSIKPLLKDQNSSEKSSYNFDIKNYSLPSTPIARSNKMRKNAWLSGDLGTPEKNPIKPKRTGTFKEDQYENALLRTESPETQQSSCSSEIRQSSENNLAMHACNPENSPASVDTVRDSVSKVRSSEPPQDFSPETDDTRERAWSFKSSIDRNNPKYKLDEEILASMNVKPLVAIHERWIYEANRKSGRSMSLPEDNSFRSQISAVKPASHCVDTLQKSLPQLNMKKCTKTFRMPASPNSNGGNWEQFCQTRETIAKGLNFAARDPGRYHTWSKESDKGTATDDRMESKIDQATDTRGIEEFIRELIRKEFQHLLHEIDETTSTVSSQKKDDIVNKGVANIMESLNNDDAEKTIRKEPKSFSRVKINGNNKPLLQITFNRSGENSLQVLDNCVNVTICDGRDASNQKLNVSMEDTLTEDIQTNALKRCQAFNALQEARSTEDLYIDDDLSTHMNENFGGKVKLIPLHGSLHEILCEKENDCCLIKVKQENGCDTIYFRCDNSDTESRDAIDGCDLDRDTVVFKRSISLIEERHYSKEKRAQTPILTRKGKKDAKDRPKSEIFAPIKRESRVLSSSSPSLVMHDDVEVNIENVMSYQDSSSDECINVKCHDGDDFELLEKKIEQDMASHMTSGCGYMEKISEENLSVFNEENNDKD